MASGKIPWVSTIVVHNEICRVQKKTLTPYCYSLLFSKPVCHHCCQSSQSSRLKNKRTNCLNKLTAMALRANVYDRLAMRLYTLKHIMNNKKGRTLCGSLQCSCDEKEGNINFCVDILIYMAHNLVTQV